MRIQSFSGWDRPILDALADFLLPEALRGSIDLGEWLIVVPTRQAGRRLREHLAHDVRRRGGTALTSVRVVTPNIFFTPPASDAIASRDQVLTAWMQTLISINWQDFPNLLGSRGEVLTDSAALDLGKQLDDLRQELTDALLTLADIPAHFSDSPEIERWQELAELEASYLQTLANAAVVDPCLQQIACARQGAPTGSWDRILLAAVPDPSPLAVHALDRIAVTRDVHVWVHAPEAESENFDVWGRPKESWIKRPIGIPPDSIDPYPSPVHACRAAATWFQDAHIDEGQDSDCALGLLDPGLRSTVDRCFAQVNLRLFHPAPIPLRDDLSLSSLLVLSKLRENDQVEDLKQALRHPLLLDVVSRIQNIESSGLLAAWDSVYNKVLPSSAARFIEHLAQKTSSASTIVDKALTLLQNWAQQTRTASGLLSVLEDLYSSQKLELNEEALRQLADLLQTAYRREKEGRAMHPLILSTLLSEATVQASRGSSVADAEGWLELAYNPGRSLLLVGFQEGIVPDTQVADAFLPDRFRKRLGLIHDERRLARDAYLLESSLAWRTPSDIRILVYRHDMTGSPVFPSRLLFHCSDDQMLSRVDKLFTLDESTDPSLFNQTPFTWDFSQKKKRGIATDGPLKLSPTSIRSFLHCPFRFYLRHVLKLEAEDDTRREPDAREFGTLCHAVLESVCGSGRLKPLSSHEDWELAIREELSKHAKERFGTHRGLPVEVSLDSIRRRLIAAIPALIQLEQEGWTTLANEFWVEREIDGALIRGKIDRIDLHKDGKRLRLIDYKTTDSGDPPEKTHLRTAKPEDAEFLLTQNSKGKTAAWKDLQLPLYRWLIEPTLSRWDLCEGIKIELAYFVLPKDPPKTHIEMWAVDRQEAAMRCLRGVVECISSKHYWPPAEPTRFDEFEAFFHHGIEGIDKDSITS